MAIRSTDSLLWSCAPDAPALSRCHLAVHKPTRIDWLCWNGIIVVVVVVIVVGGPRPVCDATFLCTSHV